MKQSINLLSKAPPFLILKTTNSLSIVYILVVYLDEQTRTEVPTGSAPQNIRSADLSRPGWES